jgi:hypothetical protein
LPDSAQLRLLQLDGLARMVWYVAFIAIVNIGLGYALANYLSAVGRRSSSANSLHVSTSDPGLDDDEYYSDEQYDEDLEDAELEAAIAR